MSQETLQRTLFLPGLRGALKIRACDAASRGTPGASRPAGARARATTRRSRSVMVGPLELRLVGPRHAPARGSARVYRRFGPRRWEPRRLCRPRSQRQQPDRPPLRRISRLSRAIWRSCERARNRASGDQCSAITPGARAASRAAKVRADAGDIAAPRRPDPTRSSLSVPPIVEWSTFVIAKSLEQWRGSSDYANGTRAPALPDSNGPCRSSVSTGSSRSRDGCTSVPRASLGSRNAGRTLCPVRCIDRLNPQPKAAGVSGGSPYLLGRGLGLRSRLHCSCSCGDTTCVTH